MSRDWVLEAVAGLSPMLELDDQVRPTVVTTLREASTLKDVEAGRWLFREGEAESDDGYVLLTGSVQVETSNGFSTQVFAPELLGEMKQFHIAGTSRRTADVRAVEPLEVLHFQWGRLYALLDARLSKEAMAAFSDAIRRYAWMHFLEDEGEI